jgi:cell division protein FtsI (penicillin-binding protein 3)
MTSSPPLHTCDQSQASSLWSRLFTMRVQKGQARIAFVAVIFAVVFLTISGRLISFALFPDIQGLVRKHTSGQITAARPDIVDRNGIVMATDIKTVSVFADPRRIIDKDEAVELLTAVLPDVNASELREKLGLKRGFIWVKREISPRLQAEVHRLGLPGVGFVPEHKRVYPNGTAAAHILGFANVDNVGIAGLEKYIDNQGLADLMGAGFVTKATDLKPLQLSIDLNVQHAMRDELAKAMDKFKAKAAAGAIIDVKTGEMVALVSLPDFDPNNPVDALESTRINRINVGVYEMGSTFKAITTAMVLDTGKATVNSTFDARSALRYGRFRINDYHGTNRVLTLPEVFIHSSNIGTAKMALAVGVDGHKTFLKKMGQLDRMRTELPESAEPIVPARWGELNTMTIAFGHGLAVAPLQALAGTAALINGGHFITPTFIKRSQDEAMKEATRVVKPETSEALRYVLRLNAERGSARKADVNGYYIGGKTGTAEKVIGGRYSKEKLLTTFMAAVPADNPQYLYLTILDEPQRLPETFNFATSGWNASPTTGKIIERTAPLLGLPPRFNPPVEPFPLMAKMGAWGTR